MSEQPVSPMLLRLATLADLDAVTDVGARAYADSEFYEWLHCNKKEYPQDYVHRWRRRQELNIAGKETNVVVCELDEDGSPRIVGFAEWIRMGDGCRDVWLADWSDEKQKQFEEIKQRHAAEKFDDRSVDNDRNAAFEDWQRNKAQQAVANAHKDAPLPENAPHWNINLLAVDPDYCRRGIGEALVKWGLNRAEEDGLHVRLFSTNAGKKLYERLGCKTIGRLIRDPEGSPEGYLDADALEWWPNKE